MRQAVWRMVAAGSALLLPFVLSPIGWWIVGDQTERSVRDRTDLMYLLEPPRWSPDGDRMALAASAALGVLLCGLLVWSVCRRRPAWLAALLVVTCALLGVAWGWLGRGFTVGVHGANMSALLVLVVPVVLLLQAGVAVVAGLVVEPLDRAPSEAAPIS